MQTFDVIIVGSGPAGCSAALAMRESGLKVALITGKGNHKEKICGGALAPYVPKVLNTIHPSYRVRFLQWPLKKPVHICKISDNAGRVVDFEFSQTGWIIQRDEFDGFLMELVEDLHNVKVFSQLKAVDIQASDNGVRVELSDGIELHGNLLIGCDGAHSIVRKKLMQTGIDKKYHATAVRAYFSGVSGVRAQAIEFHFLKNLLPGYFWIFPVRDNLVNVGIGVSTTKVIDKRINLKKLMMCEIESHPHISKRFSQAKIEGNIEGSGLPLGSVQRPISGNRLMICGDAASIVDPLTGEGIGQAMVSGRYAGWHAMKCFQQNRFDADFMKKYDSDVYGKLWQINKRRHQLRKLIERFPFVIRLGISLSKWNKAFHRRVTRHLES
jgi:menaquinone-9 beta-reductase